MSEQGRVTFEDGECPRCENNEFVVEATKDLSKSWLRCSKCGLVVKV